MRDTQLDAWDSLRGTISEKRRLVLNIITASENGATLSEICNALKWPVNRVSGRVTELAARNLVCDSGQRRLNPASGKMGIVWIKSSGLPKEVGPVGEQEAREKEMTSLATNISRVSPNSKITMMGWQAKRLLEGYVMLREAECSTE